MKGVLAGGSALFVLAVMLGVPRNDANVLFEKGLEYYLVEDFATAQRYFLRASEAGPESSFGINGRFYLGLSLFRQESYARAAEVFHSMAEEFPESVNAAEALYHVGLSMQLGGITGAETYFRRVIQQYPESRWAGFSRERLAQAQFDLGMRAFNRGDFDAAQPFFLEAAGDPAGDPAYRAKNHYFAAICDFRRSRWSDAAAKFQELVHAYPASEWTAEGLYHLGVCYGSLGRSAEARKYFQQTVQRFGGSRWSGLAAEKLKVPATQ